MKILSGFVNNCYGRKKRFVDENFFPKREIDLHLDSYLLGGHECVFYTNEEYTKDGVDVRKFTKCSPHGYLAKHQMIVQFFKDYPQEESVLYVDYDTFLNVNFDLEEVKCDYGFSITFYSKPRVNFQSGVFWVSREFVSEHYNNILSLMEQALRDNEEMKFTDEPYLKEYMNLKLPFLLLPARYNFSPHRWKVHPELIPNIIHFHVEENKRRMHSKNFLAKELLTLVEEYEKTIHGQTTIKIKHCTRHGKGTTGLLELCEHIKKIIPIKKMVEVGCYQGSSSCVFSGEFTEATIYCIDQWKNGYDDNDKSSWVYDMGLVENAFENNIRGRDNIIKQKMSSEEGARVYEDGDLDFVYIDAEHTYEAVKNDLILWKPKIKKGCFIGGHDFNQKDFPGVAEAVKEILGEPDKIFRDTSWIKRVE